MRNYVYVDIFNIDLDFESRVLSPATGYISNHNDTFRVYEVIDENDSFWVSYQLLDKEKMIQIISSPMWINTQQ